MPSLPTLAVVLQCLAERLLDGTWLAVAAWLASISVLKRASGRALAWLWLGVLVGFVVARPFTFHLLHAPRFLESLQTFERLGSWQALQPQSPVNRLELPAESAVLSALFAVYVGTVALLFGRLCLSHWRLRRRVASYAAADSATLSCVAAAARQLALTRLPEVRVTDAAVGPFSFGPARATLVLPRWLCVPGAQLDAVLLHELSHLTRKDQRWIWLQRTVTLLYFFWPPIYWVSRKLDDARELACDEQAIRAGKLQAAEYSANLLRVVAAKREARTFATAFDALGTLALGPNARRLEWRLNRLLDSKTQTCPLLIERSCLLLLCAGCLLTFRLTPNSALAAVAQALPGEDVNQTSAQAATESPNMCLPPGANAPCVLQGCGTQCAP